MEYRPKWIYLVALIVAVAVGAGMVFALSLKGG